MGDSVLLLSQKQPQAQPHCLSRPLLMLQTQACQFFRLSLPRGPGQPPANLENLCQQNVQLVDSGGAVEFGQAAAGPSCL